MKKRSRSMTTTERSVRRQVNFCNESLFKDEKMTLMMRNCLQIEAGIINTAQVEYRNVITVESRNSGYVFM